MLIIGDQNPRHLAGNLRRDHVDVAVDLGVIRGGMIAVQQIPNGPGGGDHAQNQRQYDKRPVAAPWRRIVLATGIIFVAGIIFPMGLVPSGRFIGLLRIGLTLIGFMLICFILIGFILIGFALIGLLWRSHGGASCQRLTDRFGQLYVAAPRYKQVMAVPKSESSDAEPFSAPRRGRILAGAAAVFIADGYEGASMSRIAAQASVSKGTLYNYYTDKRELFAACIRDSCALLVDEMFGDEPDDETIKAGLIRIGRAMLKMMVSPRGQAMFRLVIMEASKFPDLAALFMRAGPEMVVDRMTVWLQKPIAAGQLRLDDPAFAAEQFFALTQTRLLLRARLHPEIPPSEQDIAYVIDRAAEMFLAAYGSND